MLSIRRATQAAIIAALAFGFAAGGVIAAQTKAGKIVCWKDKNGKVVGCGDRIPPEYQDAATKELDQHGMTRKSTASADERARIEAEKKEKADEAAEKRAESRRRVEEQRRQDRALIATFTSPKEIDLKRDRDLAVVDGQLTQLRGSHKNAMDRRKEVQSRYDVQAKRKNGPSEAIKEELERANAAVAKAAERVKDKEASKDEIRERYAKMRKRFIELRGEGSR